MTQKQNIEIALAFAQESASAALNRLYSARCKKEGKGILSKLLKAIANSENVQTRRTLMHLRGKIGDPDDYIQELMKNKYENYAGSFPAIASALYAQGKNTAAEAFEQFGEVAKNHYDLLTVALDQEAEVKTTYHICQVCGYLAVDEPPPNCPICGAVKPKFKMMDQAD